MALTSGFQPACNSELCTTCEICIDRCPAEALALGEGKRYRYVNLDRCMGCGVCDTGCREEAIALVERPEIPVLPVDHRALREAVKASLL